MAYYIVNFILCICQIGFLYFNLTPKHNKYISFAVIFIPFTAAALSQRILPDVNPAILVLISHVIFFSAALTAFKEKFLVKLFVALADMLILYAMSIILIIYEYLNGSVDDMSTGVTVIDIASTVLFMAAFTEFYRMKKENLVSTKFSVIEFSVVVAGQLVSLISIAFILNKSKVIGTGKAFSFLLNRPDIIYFFLTVSIVLFVISDILLLFLIVKAAKAETLKTQLMFSEYQNKANLEYYRLVENNAEKTRKIRHDLANIVQIAYGLLSEEDGNRNEIAENILQKLNKSVKDINIEKFTDNTLINSILSIKSEECREKNIRYNFAISLPEDLCIEDIDICKIFANLIDNAINAADKCDKKLLEIDSRIRGDEIYLTVKNTYNPDALILRIENKDRHGFGQKILKDIAKKYDGEFITEREDNVYTSLLVLKLPERQQSVS